MQRRLQTVQLRNIKIKFNMLIFLISFFSIAAPGLCRAGFDVSAVLQVERETETILIIKISVPDAHYLYADKIQVNVTQPAKVLVLPDAIPESIEKTDPFFNKILLVYPHDFYARYKVRNLDKDQRLDIEVSYQGCNEKLCFMPASKRFQLTLYQEGQLSRDAVQSLNSFDPNIQSDWKMLADDFTISKRLVGYAGADKFLKFLDLAKTDKAGSGSSLLEQFNNGNMWFSLIIIFIGGLALNLTPCVLPMIPVNIAIIGAGAQAGSRIRGFFIGFVYALGIAMVYGIVGGIVVITGSTFGTLNSSPWFNLSISLIFIILSLAMFDIFTIDFSKFQTSGYSIINKSPVAIVFLIGGVSALLAGACVAPVVIAVLIFASQIYSQGNFIGIFLPFFLGLGMSSIWPFAGAGLSLLPRPGKWMLFVKKIFAVLILLSGFYYAHLAYSIYKTAPRTDKLFYTDYNISTQQQGWHDDLDLVLELSQKENKPLLIDFWASWCKNCKVMNKTTLQNKFVQERINPLIKLKFQAEHPDSKEIKEVLDYFGVIGLPTFLILEPLNNS